MGALPGRTGSAPCCLWIWDLRLPFSELITLPFVCTTGLHGFISALHENYLCPLIDSGKIEEHSVCARHAAHCPKRRKQNEPDVTPPPPRSPHLVWWALGGKDYHFFICASPTHLALCSEPMEAQWVLGWVIKNPISLPKPSSLPCHTIPIPWTCSPFLNTMPLLLLSLVLKHPSSLLPWPSVAPYSSSPGSQVVMWMAPVIGLSGTTPSCPILALWRPSPTFLFSADGPCLLCC